VTAVTAPDAPYTSHTTYDPGLRRQAVRRGRERGCWVYIPAVELEAAGIPLDEPPPFYRLNGHRRSANAGSVIVSLYREP
jgi:hypothetical protein